MASIHCVIFFFALGRSRGLEVKQAPHQDQGGSSNALHFNAPPLIGLRDRGREVLEDSNSHREGWTAQLWEGNEEVNINEYVHAFDLSRIYTAEWSRRMMSHEKPERSVHVLGLQDTGTNLLMSNLLLNFGPRLKYFDSAYKEKAAGAYGHGIWKHANICEKFRESPELFEKMRTENVVALMMVREPLSWLQSLRKAPYELKDCVAGDDWLSRPCEHPIPAGYLSDVSAKNYSNLMSIWYQWASSYEKWAQCGFSGGLVIKYEELVEQPQIVLRRIAEHLGVETPSYWRIMDDSAKTHGMSTGRAEALEKIEDKQYLSDFHDTQRVEACGNLNAESLQRYNYTECDGYLGFGWMMWHGGELPTDVLVQEFLTKHTAHVRGNLPAIQILGLQNSGTSLLMALLMMNFGRRIAYLDADFPSRGDHTVNLDEGLYRHAKLPHRMADLRGISKKNKKRPKAIAVTVVRSPLSWAESMRMMDFEPYNMSCLGSCIWGDDWLERPCQHLCPRGPLETTASSSMYADLMGVWEAWSRSYSDATKFAAFDEVVPVRYEDLVLHPEKVLEVISSHIGMPYRTPLRIQSSRNSLQTLVRYQQAGHAHAHASVKRGRSLGFVHKEQKRAICNRLSHELMESFGYKDCVSLAGRGAGMSDGAHGEGVR